MSSGKAPAGFPDVDAKLSKPVKQSAFERSKAEAEAKRKRDEAETAAVYEEFVKSFEHGDDDGPSGGGAAPQRPRLGYGRPPSGLNTGKRHFAMSGMKKSGPGSLGPMPTSFGTKRSFNDFSRGSKDRSLPSGQDAQGGAMLVSEAFKNASDDDDEVPREAIDRAELKAIAKPQLRLSNMPPGTSPAAIKALIPDGLTVDAVKIEPPSGPGSEKKCVHAVVTLSRDSPGSAMDAAVSSLQNRYLGYGHYLSVHRHLSSAVLNPVAGPPTTSSATQPFGARAKQQQPGLHRHAGQQGFHRTFAPPSSYKQSVGGANRVDHFHVPVTPPDDIKMLRHIHMTVERVLEHGPEFEALLMSRRDVQSEEKWAWLWDSRSAGGIWYRWRLWELATEYKANAKKEPHVYPFDDSPPWQVPDRLHFEFVTELDEFVSDPDYDSSDDEDMDEDGNRGANAGEVERPFLSPLEKAKLVHLLARLPTSLSKLRKGDVARVTAFALAHADRGPSEVVDLIVSNIGSPFAFTTANPHKNQQVREARQAAGAEDASTNEGPDSSAGSLIGLYLISDILSSSSATVFRHAWRFRGLFEKALKDRQVFDFLGTMAEKQSWGRLRAEKWKRSISLVLNLWEGWCLFPGKGQELFVSTFETPPSLKVEEDKVEDSSNRGKWKVVETKAAGTGEAETEEADVQMEAFEDEDDVMGEPIDEEDVEGEPIGDDDVDCDTDDDETKDEPMDDEMEDDSNDAETGRIGKNSGQGQKDADGGPGQPPRKRMRAVDMFADSDDSDGTRQ